MKTFNIEVSFKGKKIDAFNHLEDCIRIWNIEEAQKIGYSFNVQKVA